MALVRCEECRVRRNSKKYIKTVEPVGYPDTALICGTVGCSKPGLVWLTDDESKEYKSGQRIFAPQSSTAKFKVK
jgi:hypothetical protein